MWGKAKSRAVAALLRKKPTQLDQESQINHCPALIDEHKIMLLQCWNVQTQLSLLLRHSGMLTQVTACKPKQHTPDVPSGEAKSFAPLPCLQQCLSGDGLLP